VVQFLTMEGCEYGLRAKRAGFRHDGLPVPPLVPLEDEPPGIYPPLRGVTARSIDLAWWLAGGSGAAPVRRR
jgi:hypothetical protein